MGDMADSVLGTSSMVRFVHCSGVYVAGDVVRSKAMASAEIIEVEEQEKRHMQKSSQNTAESP